VVAIAEQQVPFLESGCVLIVGLVTPGGDPHATRGWGLDVHSTADGIVRVLVDGDHADTVAAIGEGTPVAVTATDVPTLRSVQLKGRIAAVETPAESDPARVARYRDEMFEVVGRTDGVPRHLLERIVPTSFVPCRVVVDDVFDQTPGPGAGAQLPAGLR